MNFTAAIEGLILRQNTKNKGGLPAVLEALHSLGDPQNNFKAVHITGTNGKGSVCALFELACRNAGLKTGLFISPHLINFTERIQICGKEIAPWELSEVFEKVSLIAPKLSFFEMMTVMAFLYFSEQHIDIAIIEVGIGGRLDSTNALPAPFLCAITSVALDHSAQLGNTLSSIAFQKAGIIKKGSYCLAPDSLAALAKAEIEKQAKICHAELVFFKNCFNISKRNWLDGYMTIRHKQKGFELPYSIQGIKQLSNASLLFAAAKRLGSLGIKLSDIEAAFAHVYWPGRFQVIKSGFKFNNAIFVLDGAHNTEAAMAFSETWAASPFSKENPAYVIAMLSDKDAASVLKCIAAFNGEFFFTKAPSERSALPAALSAQFLMLKPNAKYYIFDSPIAALAAASEKHKVVAVLGSFYLAGLALSALSK